MTQGDGWTTLGALKPGTLFEDEDGRRGAITVYANLNLRQWVNLDDGITNYDGPTLRVRPLPAPGEAPSPLTDEDRQEAKEELVGIFRDVRSGQTPSRFFARLLWLLGLSPGERAFVQALADDATDSVTIKVLSDWLRDQNREADAADMATGWRETLYAAAQEYGEAMYDSGVAFRTGAITPAMNRKLQAARFKFCRCLGLSDPAEQTVPAV
jgi:hypothetical protein